MPSQWIETDQNAHLRGYDENGNETGPEPQYKSRLVACGQFENCPEIRTDSPTCDVEGLSMLCSWTACKHVKLRAADIKNAYFNADPIDRLMLLKPPTTGIPDMPPPNTWAIAANKPIYGTGDAGRRFYLTTYFARERIS